MDLYLSGGAVRDILLRRRNLNDLDLVVVGDAVSFARRWARPLGLAASATSEFGTIRIDAKVGGRACQIDFASARTETYAHAGALPVVCPSTIDEDLARRDFSINAMAAGLSGPSKGILLDPFGGRADLAKGRIRLLHPRSAFDDPTRAFRAVRYALRFGFRIEPRSRAWIRAAQDGGAFDALSGDRLRNDLFLLFEEAALSRAVLALRRMKLDAAIAPGLPGGGGGRFRRFARLLPRLKSARRPLAAFWTWLAPAPPEIAAHAAQRISLSPRELESVRALPENIRGARRLARSATPASRLAALTRTWSPEEVVAVASVLPVSAARRILNARRRAGRIRLSIGGEDLLRQGIAPGPALGRALERTRDARIDGEIPRGRELAFALLAARR